MYKQGFRWWHMGYAAAIAFVLFVVILAATAVQVRLAERGERVSGRRRRVLPCNAALIASALLTILPLLWMVSASLMPTGEASS